MAASGMAASGNARSAGENTLMSWQARLRRIEKVLFPAALQRRQEKDRETQQKLFAVATVEEQRRLFELARKAKSLMPPDQQATRWADLRFLPDGERDEARRLLVTLETRVKMQADGNTK
jgi:hypothetical protein